MILAINMATAGLAVVLMALVLRGTVYHILARQSEGTLRRPSEFNAADWMRLGVGIYHIKAMLRIVRWDLYAPIKGMLLTPGYSRTDAVALWNSCFAIAGIAGSLCIIMALWRNIPEDERGDYTFFGSPWYPGKPPFFFGK